MTDFIRLPRADSFAIKNTHEIYRKYQIPGLRDSMHYGEGTGIEQTYNMAVTDKPMPTSTEAVPALVEVEIGNGRTKNIMRKEVSHKTVQCPECDDVDCLKETDGEVFCPECGIVMTDESDKLKRGVREAGRL